MYRSRNAWRTATLTVLLTLATSCSPTDPTADQGKLQTTVPQKQYPLGDEMEKLVAKSYSPPKSDWIEKDKEVFSSLLGTGRFDVLVAPIQVQGYGLDRSTRSLMTAFLSAAAADSTGLKVPDPYLVARALGEGQRRLNTEDIRRLADKLGAKLILVAYAGHDRQGNMALTVQKFERTAATFALDKEPDAVKTWEAIPFTDANPPAFAFSALVPTILKDLGFALRTSSPAGQPTTSGTAEELPDTPRAAANTASALQAAYRFQLLGMMAPLTPSRARERLFERSLLALRNASPDTPGYALLRARALLHLDFRAGAAAALSAPATEAERALRAALDGNLPDLEAAVPRIDTPSLKLLAAIELNDLRWRYKVNQEEKVAILAEQLAGIAPGWMPWVERRLRELDPWAMQPNLELKQILDREFPVPDYKLENIMRGAIALAKSEQAEAGIQVSVQKHVYRLLLDNPKQWCCAPDWRQPDQMDYLELVEAAGIGNLVKEVRIHAANQGLPDTALEKLDKYDAVFRGQPDLTAERARSLVVKFQGTPFPQQGPVGNEIVRRAYDSIIWMQDRTETIAEAFAMLEAFARGPGIDATDVYAYDLPCKFYRTGILVQVLSQRKPWRDRLPCMAQNTAWDFELAWALVSQERDPVRAEELLNSLKGRFQGNPQRPGILAERALDKGDTGRAEEFLREGIRSQPDAWDSRMFLARLLARDGRYGEASGVLKEFPGFNSGVQQDRVAVSNRALDAAQLLFLHGQVEMAVPFFKISAETKTGSAASLRSEGELAMLAGDWSAAAAAFLSAARRYNSSAAHAYYLSLLHVLGYQKQAWDAFETAAPSVDDSAIWFSAFVGHRLAGSSQDAVRTWITRPHLRDIRYVGENAAARFALMNGIVDRKPSPDLPKLIHELSQPPRPGPASNFLLEPFASAYLAMAQENYAEAVKGFKVASGGHLPEHLGSQFLLPYTAWASVKGDNGEFIRTQFQRLTRNKGTSNVLLAEAIVLAVGGKHDEADKRLQRAFDALPLKDQDPIPLMFTLAEFCDRLYRETGEERYRSRAIALARIYQRLNPMVSWAYAMEASLTDVPADRQRALGMALYLDRNSARVQQMPKAEIDRAKKWIAKNNPFLKARPPRAPGQSL